MNNNEQEYNVPMWYVLFKFIKYVITKIIGAIWYIVRLTFYYINKGIYMLFNLKEIELRNVEQKIIGKNYSSTNRHEITFEKTDDFVKEWKDFMFFMNSIRLDELYKEELIEYVINLITEAERSSFNITYSYLRNKKNLEPSYENMLLEKAIEEKKKKMDDSERMENPFITTKKDILKGERRRRDYGY